MTQFEWLEKQFKKYGRFFIVRVKGGPKTNLKENYYYNNRFGRYLIERSKTEDGVLEYSATNFERDCDIFSPIAKSFDTVKDRFVGYNGLQGLSDETHEAIGWDY